MATRRTRFPAQTWLPISAVCCPIGGGLLRLGHASTAAALVVAGAPYAIYALLSCFFGVAFLAATVRYLCTGQSQREFILTSANAVVSILTRTPAEILGNPEVKDTQALQATSGEASPLPRQVRKSG